MTEPRIPPFRQKAALTRLTPGRCGHLKGTMTGPDLVVVGASAGGLEALRQIIAGLGAASNLTILVAIHRGPATPGVLPQVVERAGALSASYAEDGEPIRPGHVFLAPPDHHLIVSGDRLLVTRGLPEHGFRPAIDPLFRSAARAHGRRVIGVILSGGLADGILGLAMVKQCGGIAIVQHPDDALVPAMPASAIQAVAVDHVLPAAEIGPLLRRLAGTPVAGGWHDASDLNGRSTT